MKRKKNKPPSFPFYADDWLGSSRRALMTLEQQGAYFILLCRCWSSGDCSLPDSDEQLAKLSELGNKWKKCGAAIRACFDSHPDREGCITNTKLYEINQERLAYAEEQSRRGQDGNRKRWQNGSQVRSIGDDSESQVRPSGDQLAIAKGIANDRSSSPSSIPSPISNTNPKSARSSEETATNQILQQAEFGPGFESFWSAYGKRTNIGYARNAWAGAILKEPNETRIVQAAINQTALYLECGKDAGDMKSPDRWLDGECWKDDLKALRQTLSKTNAKGATSNAGISSTSTRFRG